MIGATVQYSVEMYTIVFSMCTKRNKLLSHFGGGVGCKVSQQQSVCTQTERVYCQPFWIMFSTLFS